MKISIEFCVVWNYKPRAVGLAADIEAAYPGAAIELTEGAKGIFDVKVDGAMVFSKYAVDRHAHPGEILEALRAHLAKG